MPYPPEHRIETRRRIIASARKLFNHNGFTDVSIDEIMADAGLTRGAFYHHFKTKDDLYVEAVLHVLEKPPPVSWDGVAFDRSAPAPVFARQIIEAYLSRNHRIDKDQQCPMVALPSDVARAGPGVKAAFQKLVETMSGLFEGAAVSNGGGGRDAALAMTALCVGGMVLARTVEDEELAESILAAARAQALALGGWSGTEPMCAFQGKAPAARDAGARSGGKPVNDKRKVRASGALP